MGQFPRPIATEFLLGAPRRAEDRDRRLSVQDEAAAQRARRTDMTRERLRIQALRNRSANASNPSLRALLDAEADIASDALRSSRSEFNENARRRVFASRAAAGTSTPQTAERDTAASDELVRRLRERRAMQSAASDFAVESAATPSLTAQVTNSDLRRRLRLDPQLTDAEGRTLLASAAGAENQAESVAAENRLTDARTRAADAETSLAPTRAESERDALRAQTERLRGQEAREADAAEFGQSLAQQRAQAELRSLDPGVYDTPEGAIGLLESSRPVVQRIARSIRRGRGGNPEYRTFDAEGATALASDIQALRAGIERGTATQAAIDVARQLLAIIEQSGVGQAATVGNAGGGVRRTPFREEIDSLTGEATTQVRDDTRALTSLQGEIAALRAAIASALSGGARAQ